VAESEDEGRGENTTFGTEVPCLKSEARRRDERRRGSQLFHDDDYEVVEVFCESMSVSAECQRNALFIVYCF
jgi:hypothetical protein